MPEPQSGALTNFATIARQMAGVEGIEPSSTVLETAVLPLNYTPINQLLYYYTKFFAFLQALFSECQQKKSSKH
jgi:hypothetical protein